MITRSEIKYSLKKKVYKAESKYGKEPWTITTVHTNGTIRIQCRTKTERLNIQRVIRAPLGARAYP
jgi:hypothetical protein